MKTEVTIQNAPAYADNYPYIVARLDRNKWWFWGAYKCATLASKAAIEVGGSVFYNRAAA